MRLMWLVKGVAVEEGVRIKTGRLVARLVSVQGCWYKEFLTGTLVIGRGAVTCFNV